MTSIKSAVSIHHPINGKWVHICQVTNGSSVEYYTDGSIVETRQLKVDEDGQSTNLVRRD